MTFCHGCLRGANLYIYTLTTKMINKSIKCPNCFINIDLEIEDTFHPSLIEDKVINCPHCKKDSLLWYDVVDKYFILSDKSELDYVKFLKNPYVADWL